MERRDLLSGIADRNDKNAKPAKGGRIDPLAAKAGSGGAASEPDSGRGGGSRPGLKPSHLIVVALCISVAGTLLAHHFGIITLWGGVPPEPPLPPEVVEEIKRSNQIQQQEQERIEQLPPEQRPRPAGD